MSHRGSALLRAEIVEVGRRLYEKGLISAAEGNISVRDGNVIHVTAAGVSKGRLSSDQILRVSLEGRVLDGYAPVSSELPMHLAIYRRRPEVNAVVHAHPPTATAFAVAHIPLDRPILAESVVVLGPVPVVTYAPPATAELGQTVGGAIASANALLLANHGAVTVGETLEQAHARMETLEHLAKVTLYSRLLGTQTPLSRKDIERLLSMAGGPPEAPHKPS